MTADPMHTVAFVNGIPCAPGCWVDGHWGQYGPDHLADRASELGWSCKHVRDDPRRIRKVADWLSDQLPGEPFCKHCRLRVEYDREREAWIDNVGSGWALCAKAETGAHEPTWPVSGLWEAHTESADDIETWLNDHTTTEGYSWGWHDGEFYLWPTETWEETE